MASDLVQLAVFDDFSFGEYGSNGGRKAPPHSFTGQNVLVYANGQIGPRAGWRNRTPAGMPNGKMLGLTPTTVPDRNMMFIVGVSVYCYKLTDGTTLASIGNLGTTPTQAIYPMRGSTEFYIAVPSDKCYKLDPVAPAVTALTGSPAGHFATVYGLRLMVSDGTNRIYFSDPDDFNTWPPENFVDIDDAWDVESLRVQHNTLAIIKSRGFDVMTGVPGTSSTFIRRMATGEGVILPNQADVDQQDNIWFIPDFRTNPAAWNGATAQQVDYLALLSPDRDSDATLPLVRGIATSTGDRSPSTVVVTQGAGHNIMLVQHNGAWTQHVTSVDITGMVRGGETGDFYTTDGGGTSTPANIYSTQFNLNRPGFTTDGFVQPGDDSDTPVAASFTLPEWWTPAGGEVDVRSVVVDFTKWNTGSSSTNHFDITVHVIGRSPSGQGPFAKATHSWDEAGTAVGGTGSSSTDRKVMNFERVKGAGFYIEVTNIRGVAISSISVMEEAFPGTPRQ